MYRNVLRHFSSITLQRPSANTVNTLLRLFSPILRAVSCASFGHLCQCLPFIWLCKHLSYSMSSCCATLFQFPAYSGSVHSDNKHLMRSLLLSSLWFFHLNNLPLQLCCLEAFHLWDLSASISLKGLASWAIWWTTGWPRNGEEHMRGSESG